MIFIKLSGLPYFVIKIGVLNKNFTQNSRNFSKKFMVSPDFSSQISIYSLASGAPPPEPPTNAYDNIFLNYWHNFGEKFDKIIFKNGKNAIRRIQKLLVSIDFSTQISKIS